MLKVLLVDDNKIALDYFSHLINWEDNGFELSATAIDGESALIKFKKIRPEIVITDIQMPNMTGIQLAEKINVIAPETIIIFLSSYEEFAYVRSAMDLGIFDYILKHETKQNDLIKKLSKVKMVLEKKRREAHYISEGDLSYYINNIKNEKASNNDSIIKAFPAKYHLFVIFQDHIFTPIGQLINQSTPLFDENDFKKVIYESDEIIAAVKLDEYSHLVLSQSVSDPIECYYGLKGSLEDALEQPVSVISISEGTDITVCIEHFLHSVQLLNQKFFYPPSIVLYKNTLRGPETQSTVQLKAEEILALIESNQFDFLCKELDSSFFKILQIRSFNDFREISEACTEVLMSYHQKLLDPRTNNLFSAYDAHTASRLYQTETIFDWLKEKFSQLRNIFVELNKCSYSSVVKEVLAYICQHYPDSELSAEKIADVFHSNVNKLNSQLKKETGKTIWKMIIEVRMKKAKELLNTREYKIFEISELVGYKAVSYFSNVYKKYFGVSPQEYRKSHEK